MKKKMVLGTVLFVLLVLQVQTVFANGQSESSSPPPPASPPPPPPRWAGITLTGEDEPLLEGTIWTWYDPYNVTFLYTYEFRAGGRLLYKVTTPNPEWNVSYNNTWQRDGDIVKMIFADGYTLFEGKYYPQTQRIMITGTNSKGETWDQTWEPYQGSGIVSVPSTPYVQPSTPAPSTPVPAPSTPTLQTGRYAWSNSGTNMTMTLSSGGMVSAFLNNSPIGVWHGTYRINGNQLVITVSNPTSDYANLRGQTYAYTITSNTSFSGSGETWVRTGSF